MNISQENIDALNAVVTLKISKADYEPKVEEVLKQYRKTASIPGFRPGHVPVSMVRKMFGKRALVEQVDKLVGESLMNYIRDNKLDIIGEPLPSADMKTIDFDADNEEFEFKFDIALTPEINLDINDKITIPSYTIEVTDDQVNDRIGLITSQHATADKVEAISETSFVKCSVSNAAGVVAESASFSPNQIKDEAARAAFVGKKQGEVVTFDGQKTFGDELAGLLKLSKDEAAKIEGELQATIGDITEYRDAELNQELFDQVFGKDAVKSADEFRAKVRETIEAENAGSQDYRFIVDAREQLVKLADMSLPEAFLKRWLTAINSTNEKFTPELLESEMPKFLEDLRWKIVRDSIIRKNDIKMERAGLEEYAKKTVRSHFMRFGVSQFEPMVERYAADMLKNEEQVRQLSDGYATEAAVDFVKGKVTLQPQTVSREAFEALFANKQ